MTWKSFSTVLEYVICSEVFPNCYLVYVIRTYVAEILSHHKENNFKLSSAWSRLTLNTIYRHIFSTFKLTWRFDSHEFHMNSCYIVNFPNSGENHMKQCCSVLSLSRHTFRLCKQKQKQKKYKVQVVECCKCSNNICNSDLLYLNILYIFDLSEQCIVNKQRFTCIM